MSGEERNDAFGIGARNAMTRLEPTPSVAQGCLPKGFTPSGGVVQRVPPPKAAHTANGFVGSLVCCEHHEGEMAGYDPNDSPEWME